MAKKNNRFAFLKSEESGLGLGAAAQVLVDKRTGVNYLYVGSGYGGGLCPLLDREGRPIVTAVTGLEE